MLSQTNRLESYDKASTQNNTLPPKTSRYMSIVSWNLRIPLSFKIPLTPSGIGDHPFALLLLGSAWSLEVSAIKPVQAP